MCAMKVVAVLSFFRLASISEQSHIRICNYMWHLAPHYPPNWTGRNRRETLRHWCPRARGSGLRRGPAQKLGGWREARWIRRDSRTVSRNMTLVKRRTRTNKPLLREQSQDAIVGSDARAPHVPPHPCRFIDNGFCPDPVPVAWYQPVSKRKKFAGGDCGNP